MPEPRSMKALIVKHDGLAESRGGTGIDSLEPYLDYTSVPVPEPRAGQVLVRMRMASVNPSDIYFIKGEYGQPRVKGQPAGFEGVGDVVGGKGLYAAWLKGKRVAFVGGVSGSGAWADYIVVPASQCEVVKSAMRDEDAAGHVVNPVTAWTMFDIVRKSKNKSFVFTAANSQLGKLMAGLARDHGICMIGVIRKESQAAHLKDLGAKHVLVQTEDGFAKEFATLAASEKPRILLDAVADQTSADLFTAMPSRARWIIYGWLASTAPTLHQPGQFIFMDKKLEGYWLAKWFRQASIVEKLRTLRGVQDRFISGAWKTEVSATIRLADAVRDLPAALERGDGKVMLVP
ncbi:alcohol dehydrogenase catalytic domain-containing protein [Hoeflea olei]|uniref:Enoyl reductase (ER) domain-containing protein n=1 Tax=Hoeflea olei TaxID=1480615 RepID=A0A1C1YXH2_9HYPH|nr:zinc-binding dehydrogenase [Hoeflea olei]OCW58211.1 hypothetical protein AWJ14_01240 [Hoeflea olei]